MPVKSLTGGGSNSVTLIDIDSSVAVAAANYLSTYLSLEVYVSAVVIVYTGLYRLIKHPGLPYLVGSCLSKRIGFERARPRAPP